MELNEIKIRIRKTVPVSSKKDPFCLNNIYLSSNKSVTFGRQLTEGVHVRLLSKTTPLMISRKHATIAPSPESSEEKVCFAVTDHNSMNGVYVNNSRITASEPHDLDIGDAITFGCGVGSQPAEFEYIFEAVSTKTNKRVDHLMNQNISPTKKKRVTDSPSVTIIESKSIQITEQEAKISRLSEELLIKENIQNELQNKLQETETGLIEKLEKQKSDLEVARENAELELKQMLENQLKQKETELKCEFEEQLKSLENEKICVESKLKEELSHKLSEKDQLYHEELKSQKLSLEQAMIDKENELIAQLKAQEGVIEQYKSVEENQKELENCLLELRKEIQDKESQLRDQKEVTKKVESEAKQNVIQTMEDEFTCIICQELFIEATTLPCAHTFCELCLKLWMRKKKNCPVCRRHIKGRAVRSVVLDSAVEKMIEAMEEGAILRRRELKSERLIQKRKEEASEGIVSFGHTSQASLPRPRPPTPPGTIYLL